ncbi:MAG: Pyruvate:ferredoxin oxidoreductase or related 2-oxoacid:ferredoxin oxidoreductase [Candidatus Alkanophagales archaeon MCA70_species_2]|nr:Pyruvate:ferredoxin oxidoreductase or related 2-oxoacid:ferredoxin oxidoreductase [Candidatus Alkanophaga liquidiphilum]
MEDPWNVVICGVGGQGNVLASQILASAAIKEGFIVTVGETYGASQRGGSVQSHLRFSKRERYGPLIPKGMAHVVLGFEPVEMLRVLAELGSRRTRVIVNPRPIYPIEVLAGDAEYPPVEEILRRARRLAAEVKVVEATEIAKEVGDTLVQNMVMMGCLIGDGLVPLHANAVEKAIEEHFDGREGYELNLRAFREGMKIIRAARTL